MKKFILLILIGCVLFPSWIFAVENLDEVTARINRYTGTGHNTFGYQYLENQGGYYYWNPETLCYTDIMSGHEVWVMTRAPNYTEYYSNEVNTRAWTRDGSRIGFHSYGKVQGTGRYTGNASLPYTLLWITNSDGTKMRALEGYGRRGVTSAGFGWSATEQAYYRFGGDSDGDIYKLYRMDLDTNNQVAANLIWNSSALSTYNKQISKNSPSPDNSRIVAYEDTPANARNLSTPNPINTVDNYFINDPGGTPTLAYHWGAARHIGPSPWTDPYGNQTSANEVSFHSLYAIGPSGNTVLGTYSNASTLIIFKDHGSYTDGGPLWEDWNGSTFGTNEEIKVIGTSGTPANPYGLDYMGHPAFDPWGKYAIAGITSETYKGTRIFNMSTMTIDNTKCVMNNNQYEGYHHAWGIWSDYVVGYGHLIYPLTQTEFYLTINKYTDDYTTAVDIVNTHSTGALPIPYTSYPRPSQSPDGTKVAYATPMLSPNANQTYQGINWVVAYYPYPPEIYQANGTGAALNIRFDWGTNSGTWRGYTSRKWPDESTGAYLIPRETDKFRLWVSTDNTTWTPVTTTNATPFTKYDFAVGGFKGGQTSYWEIATTQGNSLTRYYVVTPIETSGLEGRALSNTWKVITDGAGAITSQVQQSAYPASPGEVSSFYTTAPGTPQTLATTHKKSPATADGQYTLEWTEPVTTTLVRHYNIYASDTGNPTAIQQRRIASISRNYCSGGNCSWIDWLGKTDGSTIYGITSVDTQGNESSILLVGGTPPDTTPPVMSNPLPTGVQTCSADPTTIGLEIYTDEYATCKYDASDKSYDDMIHTFFTTGQTYHHQTSVSLGCSASYTYYARCADGSGNKNTSSEVISFSVGSLTKSVTIGAGSNTISIGAGSNTISW